MVKTIIKRDKIVSNTIFLYLRMLLIMGANLIVVRKLLQILGASDFGLYNVIGGVTAMFVFLNNAMALSSQRYISVELSRGNIANIQRVYSSIVVVYLGICCFILIIGETLGLWFVMTQLKYESTRLLAVFWSYQFTLFSLILVVFSSNFNAAIISYEKMNIYAFIGILETLSKLVAVYSLEFIDFDRVIIYSFFILLTSFLTMILYYWYCRRYCRGCRFQRNIDRRLIKELVGFSGWNLFGSISGVLRSNGINIILNIFFGTIINAARAISYQVYGAIHNFSNNFYLAMRPQLMKSYAIGDVKGTMHLLFSTTKASFYLLLLLVLPVIANTAFLLDFWLKNFPQEAIVFTQLVLINLLLESISNPLMTLAQATGDIKNYQIFVGGLLLLNLPVSFTAYLLGAPVISCFIIMIIINVFALYFRLHILSKIASLDISNYFFKVIIPLLAVSIPCFLILQIMSFFHNKNEISFFIFSTIVSTITVIMGGYSLGFTKREKEIVKKVLRNAVNKLK